MWPGSEAHIGSMEPTFVDEFNADEDLGRKVDRILHWLDLPGDNDTNTKSEERRPQLIAAYVPDVDADGHKYGPNSTYIRSTIAEVDGMLGTLFKGIDERNLTNVVNIIVVSDHGMATTSTSRLVQLEDLIDTSLIEHTDGWPLYGLRPYKNDEGHLIELYNTLYAKSRLPKYKDAFDVYLRDKNMPSRWHFAANPRIAPLWIIPRAGWAIVTKDEFNIATAKKKNEIYHPRGLHGYDHEHPLMRAVFVARGPAFPHPEGSRVKEFQNTEVYNIVCDSLGLEPKPNNGTIRLPFKTNGKHDFEAGVEEVHDPPSDDDEVDGIDDGIILPPEVPNLNDFPKPPTPPSPPKAPTPPSPPPPPDRPVVHDGDATEKGEVEGWWEWVKNKVNGVKGWVVETFGVHKTNKGQKEGEKEGGKDGGKDGKGREKGG
jgi:hypothetical protein